MKEAELREKANCGLCGLPIGHTGLPFFYRVSMESFGVKLDAVRRQSGREMMMGGHVQLAGVMGPNEDMAESMGPATEFTVCQTCYADKEYPLRACREMAEEKL